MKKILFATIISVFLISTSIFLSTAAVKIEKLDFTNLKDIEAGKGDGKTEYWALLVAVGVYADNPIENIPTMLEGADMIYKVLLDSPFWSADHIKVIKGKNATIMNIIKGLRWLDRKDDGDDISLVYFNSHGGHLKLDIPPYDEKDGTDECLSSYWGFAYPNNPIGFLWDDELNFLLNRLESQGVCLIVDSCFSGGFNDPPNWNRNRGSALSLSTKYKHLIAMEWMEGFIEELRGDGRVVITSCREEELSWVLIFKPFFIDGLRGFADMNTDGFVSAEELFLYTKSRCYWQQPTIYDSYDGELPIIQIDRIKPINDCYKTEYIRKPKTEKTPICSVDSFESALICGYVTDAVTNDPIDAYVDLRWYDGIGNYDYNWTHCDSNGFYSFNVPEGYVYLDFDKDDYLFYESEMYKISEYEILWINASLNHIPPENAIVCGYVKDSETGKPIVDAGIQIEWHNDEGQIYWKWGSTDSSGFYSLNIAAGEVYHEVWEHGYLDEKTYRHDINEEHPFWFNFSLDPEKISVYISKPLNAIYRNNKRLIPFIRPLIIKSIEIEAFAHDYWYNLWDYIDKVEFYIDGILKATVNSEPYSWRWNEKTLFRFKHTIKVIAYDYNGNFASDIIEVWKFL